MEQLNEHQIAEVGILTMPYAVVECMNLEDIMLNEIHQSQGQMLIPLILRMQKSQTQRNSA